MLVTTNYDPDEAVRLKAEEWAVKLGGIFRDRKGLSIARLQQEDTVVLVVMKNLALKAHRKGHSAPFFFHPGIAMLRIKRLICGDNDVMSQICALQPGDSFLDCTLGFGGDAMVASYVVGEQGKVVGLESEPLIAAIVEEGLSHYNAPEEVQQAMKRIEVKQRNHLTFLQQCENNSFDIVYFDPMFFTPIERVGSIDSLRTFANGSSLTVETITEAKRVARRRVVMKNHARSGDFARLGFLQVPTQRERSFTYGIIEVGDKAGE